MAPKTSKNRKNAKNLAQNLVFDKFSAFLNRNSPFLKMTTHCDTNGYRNKFCPILSHFALFFNEKSSLNRQKHLFFAQNRQFAAPKWQKSVNHVSERVHTSCGSFLADRRLIFAVSGMGRTICTENRARTDSWAHDVLSSRHTRRRTPPCKFDTISADKQPAPQTGV